MGKEIRDFLKEVISIVVMAFILAIILRTFLGEGRVIPSGSMLPTIHIKDKVWVDKIIYRFKDPARGDIVVFTPPEELGQKGPFIKRVIGLPGETVEVRDGKVFINGVPLQEPYIAEPPMYEYGPVKVPKGAFFVMGDNRNYSLDSHMWNSWLRQDHIWGKALLIYWPPNRIKLLERGVST
ncbi:MAG: signal peptidase I [Syntrophomonadaceae bacterium]|nr:signal peptidase I [Syntrophomonadaceae bacterium]